MRAILFDSPGGPEVLYTGEYPTPSPGPKEILVKVHATALNRADLLQRQGKYPPPPGESPVLGLEMAGEVAAVGAEVSRWQEGDRVMALLAGGGYAEYAVVHEDLAMAIPEGWTYVQAAAVPEVFLTAFQALCWLGELKTGERLLLHAGGSGVGTAAIQIAKEMGAEIWVTASAGKHEACLELGAQKAIDYKKEDFVDVLKSVALPGADLIVDFIGGPYFTRNLECLRTDGRLVLLAAMGGLQTEPINVGLLLRKRLQVKASTLRARSLDYKIRLTQEFTAFAAERFSNGSLAPVIDRVFDWTGIQAAHRYMAGNANVGKIVLAV